MGLLDWLTEGAGSDMGGSSMGSGFSPPPGLPPVQMTGTDAPPLAPPAPPAAPPGLDPTGQQRQPFVDATAQSGGAPGGDLYPPGLDPMTAGGPMPNGPGLPPQTPFPPAGDPMTAGGPMPNGPGLPVPLPTARPPGLGGDTAALPPAAAPTAGAPPVIMGTGPLAPGAAPPDGSGRGFSLLRAMGLDGPTAERMRGSLGAGLKSVPGNAHAPGLAAFAGSAGAGIEGGKAAGDKHIDQQDKYLTRAIAAAQVGNTKAANEALTQLRQAQTKQIQDGKGDKASVMNSNEQLYLRGLGAVNQDKSVAASAAGLREMEKANAGGQPTPELQRARAAHNALIEERKKVVLGNLGISEKDAAAIGKKPGFSDQNPVKSFPKDAAAAQKAYDALPDGAYFINPKDGQLRIKQSKQPAAAGANPAAAPQSPPTAPPMLDPATAIAPAADEED